MNGPVWEAALTPFRLVLQGPFPPEPSGVDVPILPLLVAAATLAVVAAIVAAAFLKPAAAAVNRRRRGRAPRRDVVVRPPPAASPAPLLKKAPVKIQFAQIRDRYPDVWGVGEPIDIQFRLTEKDLMGRAKPEGLAIKLDGEPVDASFKAGKASVTRTFPARASVPITVEYHREGEPLPRRTTRTLRIVEYREEIAEVFHKFRDEASRAIAPVPEDATPWEVLDILTGAKPDLPQETVRRIVASFEIAKFSNHPVGRADYERMIEALLELERVEL